MRQMACAPKWLYLRKLRGRPLRRTSIPETTYLLHLLAGWRRVPLESPAPLSASSAGNSVG